MSRGEKLIFVNFYTYLRTIKKHNKVENNEFCYKAANLMRTMIRMRTLPGKTRRSAIDWASIRQRFETTGQRELSTRQIARDNGITETAIRKKAKAESWLRRDQRERLLYGGRLGLGAKIIDWPRLALGAERPRTESDLELSRGPTTTTDQTMRRDLPPRKLREGRKVSSEDLIDGLSHAAQSLLSQLNIAINRRSIMIKIIEEWEPGIGGKMPAKYSLLQKELELKTLTSVLFNLATVYKFIADLSSDDRTTGAASGRERR